MVAEKQKTKKKKSKSSMPGAKKKSSDSKKSKIDYLKSIALFIAIVKDVIGILTAIKGFF